MSARWVLTVVCSLVSVLGVGLVSTAFAETEAVVSGSALILKSDNGNFPGVNTGITHQRDPSFQIRKIIDVSTGQLRIAHEAQVQVFFGPQARDKDPGAPLDSFDVMVNGHTKTISFGDLPNLTYWGPSIKQDRNFQWYTIPIPVEWLEVGENTIIMRKTPQEEYPSDYLYVGIDHSAEHGKSAFSRDGGRTWDTVNLNVPGSTGEYMIRMLLVTESREQVATLRYEPDLGMTVSDPGLLIRRHERIDRQFNIDFYPGQIGTYTQVHLTSVTSDLHAYDIRWLNEQDQLLGSGTQVDVGHEVPTKLRITPLADHDPDYITQLTIRYAAPLEAPAGQTHRATIAPAVADPAGAPTSQEPQAVIEDGIITLSNGFFELQLGADPILEIQELRVAYNNWENIIVAPENTELFWAKVNNQDVRAREFRVQGVTPLTAPQQGVDVALVAEQYSLRGKLQIAIDETREIRLSLEWFNDGSENLRVKTAFPHLGGIRISARDEDDYYLFPIKGGVISSKAGYLNSAYGETTGFWQMLDVYSPEMGMGLYVRIDDTTGLHKHMSLSKGKDLEVEYNDVGYRAPDPEISWAYDRLLRGAQEGTAMAFGYQARTLQPGGSLEFPTAVVGVHAGDWHTAMEIYAAWAHEVWEWQPYPGVLTHLFGSNYIEARGVLNIPRESRFVRAGISLHPQNEYVELSPGWWKRGETGPWGVPLDPGLTQARELLGDSYIDRKRDWFGIDPVTGEMRYSLNRGDYEYNPDWGGKEALKTYVDTIKAAGGVVSVVTYPLLVAGDTEAGRLYGERLGVMNPIWDQNKRMYEGSLWTPLNPEGYVNAYASWNMSLDNEEWQDYFISVMVRLATDLGVGIRVDEMGLSRAQDYSTKHSYMYAQEPGDLTYFQAQGQFLRKLRKAMDEVDPNLPLTAESPGNDYLSRSLTGALSYNFYQYSRVQHINPVVLNLIRFYFPEMRTFEFLVVETEPKLYEQAFWQAIPLRGMPWRMDTHYSDAHFTVLKENSDAFDGPDLKPLVPTLIENVYANRFSSGSKTVFQFYNDTGRVVSGPIMSVPHEPDVHYFDLLHMNEVEVSADGTISATIAPDTAASIVKLPSVLSAEFGEWNLSVEVDEAKVTATGLILQVLGEDQRVIQTEVVRGGGVSIPLFRLEGDTFVLKLMRDGMLVDAIEAVR